MRVMSIRIAVSAGQQMQRGWAWNNNRKALGSLEESLNSGPGGRQSRGTTKRGELSEWEQRRSLLPGEGDDSGEAAMLLACAVS